MQQFFEKFKIDHEKERIETIISTIENGVAFRGTNLWILIFAIFVASLGLNVNSPAVIIGAMLISPLMGPIMGMGLGIGMNNLILTRRAIYNYLVATLVALSTSTIFFLISPLDDAHSEILARTSPNIYDVLIAFFGGLAGIIATSSKLKGNVIPGVAIATALMPPLCTAGYGLATLQFKFFYGAFYLYIINTVFIALATFSIVRILHFPFKNFQNARADKIANRIVWGVVIITLLPSLYFGYDLVEQNRFTKKANRFIANEANFPNDYLLSKKIDAKEKTILLVFGGYEIPPKDIERVESRLGKYGLENAVLEIKQGFSYLSETVDKPSKPDYQQLSMALDETSKKEEALKRQLDSINADKKLSLQVFSELKTQYPFIKSAIVQPSVVFTEGQNNRLTYLLLLKTDRPLMRMEINKISNWAKVRLNNPDITLITR